MFNIQQQHPTFKLKMPFTDRTLTYRPFTVKEEKILLIAQMDNNPDQRTIAVEQIVRNCVQEQYNVRVEPTFNTEWVFINLIAKSMNNILSVSVKDADDNKQYQAQIDIDKVTVFKHEHHTNIIKCLPWTVQMKYPTYDDVSHIGDILIKLSAVGQTVSAEIVDNLFTIYANHIDKIYNDQHLYVAGKDFNASEAKDILESFDGRILDQFEQFFTTIPCVYYQFDYTNTLGVQKTVELRGIQDFF